MALKFTAKVLSGIAWEPLLKKGGGPQTTPKPIKIVRNAGKEVLGVSDPAPSPAPFELTLDSVKQFGVYMDEKVFSAASRVWHNPFLPTADGVFRSNPPARSTQSGMNTSTPVGGIGMGYATPKSEFVSYRSSRADYSIPDCIDDTAPGVLSMADAAFLLTWDHVQFDHLPETEVFRCISSCASGDTDFTPGTIGTYISRLSRRDRENYVRAGYKVLNQFMGRVQSSAAEKIPMSMMHLLCVNVLLYQNIPTADPRWTSLLAKIHTDPVRAALATSQSRIVDLVNQAMRLEGAPIFREVLIDSFFVLEVLPWGFESQELLLAAIEQYWVLIQLSKDEDSLYDAEEEVGMPLKRILRDPVEPNPTVLETLIRRAQSLKVM